MFSKIGELIFRLFSAIGGIILAIPKIPQKIRNVDQDHIKEKLDTEKLKENVSKVRDDLGIDEKVSQLTSKKEISTTPPPETYAQKKLDVNVPEESSEESESAALYISQNFTSQEKEDTIFRLQILSASFLVLSVLYLFNFISIILYAIIGILLGAYIIYLLFTRVKFMYGSEFSAYRDFFLMYIAVGIILVVVGTNPNLVMAFTFQAFPSLTLLIFAIIAVAVVFLIFRLRYHRNFTYGTVIETSKRLAYVKVEYDIRCNVKPDIYAVENVTGALDGDTVKLETEEKLFSNRGNKPIRILETVKKI